MRITDNLILNHAIANLNKSKQRLDQLQRQVSSGKRIHKPEDDPFATEQALYMRASLKANASYQRMVDVSRSWLKAAEVSLQTMVDLVMRAHSQALSAANDTLGPDERAIIATEVREHFSHAIAVGNTRHQGRYIFGGYQTDSEPVTLLPDLTWTYNGDAGVMSREVEAGQMVDINLVGPDADTHVVDSVYQALYDLIMALEAPDGDIRARIPAIERALDVLQHHMATVGTRLHRLGETERRLALFDINLQERISRLEDVDLAEAIMRLSNQETQYQAMLQVAARLPQPLLIELLR